MHKPLKEFAPGKSYEWLIQEAEAAPNGPTGILFLPHLWGSSSLQSDPASQAAMTGLQAHHRRPHIIKSLFEGLSFEANAMMQDVETLTHTRTKELLVIGGATKNSAWMKAKSQITGLPLQIVSQVDAVTLGAALLAGQGIGLHANEKEMRTHLHMKFQRLPPSQASVNAYLKIRPAFNRLYHALKSIHAS